MNFSYIIKSILFYRRTHLGVVLGVAVSTAILVGALVIGDSIRYSLRQLVFDRLGQTAFALQTGDRFFRSQLADELSDHLETLTAPVLHTHGIAIAAGGEFRVNKVEVFGVDNRFGAMGHAEATYQNPGQHEVILNQRLAKKLDAAVGDEILLRMEKLDAMPQDAPLATDTDISVSQRFTVKAVVTEKEFSRFNLKTSQVEPYSAFISLSGLGVSLEIPGKANVLLVGDSPDKSLELSQVQNALDEFFTLTDAGLSLKSVLAGSALELRSDRIFLDPPIVHRLKNSFPNARPIFTYFVNQLRVGSRTTPYSFVASVETMTTENVRDDEIIINRWLANDLDANIGDDLELTYFTIGPMRALVKESSTFHIKKIVPMSGHYVDRDLMPAFPGLSDEENCRDWQAGIPIDYDTIRDKDEKYWDDYRGAPKAFVSLNTAQRLWGNRFGNLTAIRFQRSDEQSLEHDIVNLLDPLSFGFVFQPVREQGLRAGEQSVDFGQLFIGLSFFLIVAALLLTGLLFVFSVEQRSQESGLLLALGFPSGLVRRYIVAEGVVLAVLGSVLGLVLGLLYHEIVLYALKTIWADIVGTSALSLKVKPLTIFIGMVAGIVMSVLSMWLPARWQAKQSIADLQRGVSRIENPAHKKSIPSIVLGSACILAVIAVLLTTNPGNSSAASSAFFAAGALLLVAGLAFSNVLLVSLHRATDAVHLTLKSIGRRNNARRRRRSLALIGVLASGVFITFTVGANRTSSLQNADARSSGTGGFALWGETALPILYDLNSEQGQDFYGFEKGSADFLQLKVKEGDDASCLNLNRIANPRVLGVAPKKLDDLGAFSFVALADDIDAEHPWDALTREYDGHVIPGFADQTVIVWGLGKSVGDTLTYSDENGGEFHIRLVGGLANSIFQGSVLIAERHFVERYPSIGGYRNFLIDVPPAHREETATKLTWAFQDQGLDVTPTAERLAEFNKVTNTYLSIFMILGGLGLILGSVGIGIVLLRNVMERRGELALMRAVGFDVPSLQKLILSEHLVLLLAGIAVGVLASLFAVLPALLTPGTRIPWMTILVTLVAVVGSGVLWTWLAAKAAMRGELLAALRNE